MFFYLDKNYNYNKNHKKISEPLAHLLTFYSLYIS